MPLSLMENGSTGCIKKITGNDDVRLHLAELGFVIGQNVTVVNKISGNMILNVKDTRIALDESMTNRIMV